jgi:methionyl-tRNA formyltransferase
MKYVFFGTPRFAEIILAELIDASIVPVAVVCNPDRPVGRKKIMTSPSTKLLAAAHPGIAVLQPEILDAAFEKILKDLQPDLFVVAAYGKIIPRSVLDIPKMGTLGVHPSLLPKYRGASPIQSTILGGEKETGVTIYKMDAKMDHGEIMAVSKVKVDEDETFPSLLEKLGACGGKLLAETLPKFASAGLRGEIQDEAAATFTKKFKTEDGSIAPEDLKSAENGDAEKAAVISRMIRALNPEPGVWTMRDGKRLKLLEAKLENGALRLAITQREGEKAKHLP